MQTRLYFTVILLTLCELVYSFPQNETDSLKVFQENKDQESLISIDSISDTEKDKKPLLIDLVRYKAKDYVRIDQNEKKLEVRILTWYPMNVNSINQIYNVLP